MDIETTPVLVGASGNSRVVVIHRSDGAAVIVGTGNRAVVPERLIGPLASVLAEMDREASIPDQDEIVHVTDDLTLVQCADGEVVILAGRGWARKTMVCVGTEDIGIIARALCGGRAVGGGDDAA